VIPDMAQVVPGIAHLVPDMAQVVANTEKFSSTEV
jgi:hypothetical protein